MASKRVFNKFKPYLLPIESLQQSYKVSFTIIPALKRKKLKFEDVKQKASSFFMEGVGFESLSI